MNGVLHANTLTDNLVWIKQMIMFLGFWGSVPWFGVCRSLYWGSSKVFEDIWHFPLSSG